MATVTEVKAEQDYHWCSDCGLYSGFSMDEEGVDFSNGDAPIDDMELAKLDDLQNWINEHKTMIRTGSCGCKVAKSWEDPDPEIIDIARGDVMYECDDCGSHHATESAAENCC